MIAIRKNAREELRITVEEFKGHTLLNLRVWYDDGAEMKPGKQGLALRLELLPDLRAALDQLAEASDGAR